LSPLLCNYDEVVRSPVIKCAKPYQTGLWIFEIT